MPAPTSRIEAASFTFTTPCCGARPHFSMRFEGAAYMQSEVVDGIECMECGNTWRSDGSPWQIITTPAPKDRNHPEEETRWEFFEEWDPAVNRPS